MKPRGTCAHLCCSGKYGTLPPVETWECARGGLIATKFPGGAAIAATCPVLTIAIAITHTGIVEIHAVALLRRTACESHPIGIAVTSTFICTRAVFTIGTA